MADMLQSGVTWLAGERKSSLGQSVTYARGTSTVAVTATVTNPGGDVDEATFIRHRADELDFVLTWAELLLAGAQVTPREGDRITFGSDTYEVTPGEAGKAYRTCDPYGTSIRIHAQRVD